ncbi:MAG: MoxR family ATPase [Deltaproteobacteria bacterium]|nr:MAG: MoxR family ATPase [Deltaproteobacteria bacterium]
MTAANDAISSIRSTIKKVVLTQSQGVELTLIGILSGGHVLLEDVPGVGKTTLAKTVARSLNMEFSRVQFTPDLLPTDILGTSVLNPKDGSFHFQEGPIFHNLLLADEINRASPRTQSALLEAMNEKQVTIDGKTRPLPKPFFVIATQNPVDYQGTYPLPEAQLDRFLLRVSLGYPSKDHELQMLFDRQSSDPLDDVKPVMDLSTLLDLQAQVRQVTLEKDVGLYLHGLIEKTRNHKELVLGASPRATLALFRACQARAFMHQRDYVSPDDVQALAAPVLAHRVMLTNQARYSGKSTSHIVSAVVDDLRVPT